MPALPAQNVVLRDIAGPTAKQNIGLCWIEICEKHISMKIACGPKKRHKSHGVNPTGTHRSWRIHKTFLYWFWSAYKVTPLYHFSLFCDSGRLLRRLHFSPIAPLYRKPLSEIHRRFRNGIHLHWHESVSQSASECHIPHTVWRSVTRWHTLCMGPADRVCVGVGAGGRIVFALFAYP